MNMIVRPVAPELEDESAPISLRAAWAAFVRRRRLVSSVFLSIAAVVLVALVTQPPRYRAASTLMIRPVADRLLGEIEPAQSTPANPNTLSAAVDSEVEILRSRELARRIVDKLGLARDPEWNPALRRPTVLGWPLPSWRSAASADEVADELIQAVSVRRRAVSEVVDIEVEASSPQRAAQIANVYVTTYVEMSVEAQNARTEQAIQWLNQRLRGLQEDLRAKEEAVAAFRQQSGLYVGTGETLSEQQVRAIQDSIVVARADLAERGARYGQLRALIARGGNADSISSALTSDVIRDLRREEAVLSRTQAEMETRLTDTHPNVMNGRQQLRDIRSQIQAEMSRIAANAEGEVMVAQARLNTLEASLGSAGGHMAGGAEVRLAQLNREAVAARTVYEGFLQRYHQIVGQGETAPMQVRLVSSAVAPQNASWPDWRIALLIALACGLIGAALVLLAVELFTDPVASAEDLEKRVGIATLAAVPLVERGALRLLPPESRHPAGYLADKRFSAYAEAFRGLRTSLRFANPEGAIKVIVVTSAQPNEGKTTCALSLARASAMAGQRVILIDCDVRRRALNELLNIDPQRGLWHVLTGQTQWRSVVGVDVATSAHILPSAPGDFASGDVLCGEAMDGLLAELRSEYDVIVLDCPPVWALADARLLAAKGDGVVLVSRWNRTSVPSLAAAIRHLTPSGARMLGVVVNGVNGDVARWAGYAEYGFGAYASQYVVN